MSYIFKKNNLKKLKINYESTHYNDVDNFQMQSAYFINFNQLKKKIH